MYLSKIQHTVYYYYISCLIELIILQSCQHILFLLNISIVNVNTHLYVIIQLCCSLYSTYIQAILYIIVQFNASFAHVQPTSSLYILLLQFFVDCMVWHRMQAP